MYAISEFITMSLLPSVVAPISAARGCMRGDDGVPVASVVAAATVGPCSPVRPPTFISRGVAGFSPPERFVCMLAPSMPALLAEASPRAAGGMPLAGLGYAR